MMPLAKLGISSPHKIKLSSLDSENNFSVTLLSRTSGNHTPSFIIMLSVAMLTSSSDKNVSCFKSMLGIMFTEKLWETLREKKSKPEAYQQF